jgi:hypothetical protein
MLLVRLQLDVVSSVAVGLEWLLVCLVGRVVAYVGCRSLVVFLVVFARFSVNQLGISLLLN